MNIDDVLSLLLLNSKGYIKLSKDQINEMTVVAKTYMQNSICQENPILTQLKKMNNEDGPSNMPEIKPQKIILETKESSVECTKEKK